MGCVQVKLRKTTKILSYDIRNPVRDSNRLPAKYKNRVTPLREPAWRKKGSGCGILSYQPTILLSTAVRK
jgi:hypothetical protein